MRSVPKAEANSIRRAVDQVGDEHAFVTFESALRIPRVQLADDHPMHFVSYSAYSTDL